MIRATPKGWLSSHFKIFENDNEITELDFKNVGQKVSVEIQDETYEFKPRVSDYSAGSYIIESNNSALAFAERVEDLDKTFSFVLGEKEYLLRPDSTWGRKFVLLENEEEVGAIYPKRRFSSNVVAELPNVIPLPIRVFMLWLVVSFWKKDEDDAALISVIIATV
jgi:hypothetical protein